ncbi:hypothetical protein RAM80_07670 [Pseudomonas sp. App30]|uniref:hypothetical protein n=1 Tax=unclassified Pseudomonas TaxID=196821 RepID=UPI0002608834|nr:hypothetical protein [Pseudomonas sp. M47T1]EIK96086.1 hypothetical protein PMM47T1_14040 [Pseudomonas sp. M47T1]
MSLKDQGFRFCVSPNKQDARWLHPAVRKAMHADWIDVTDWPSEKLLAFLLPEPQQHELFSA